MKERKLGDLANGGLGIAADKLAEEKRYDVAVRALNTARVMTNGHGKSQMLENQAYKLIKDHNLSVTTDDYLTEEDKKITIKMWA